MGSVRRAHTVPLLIAIALRLYDLYPHTSLTADMRCASSSPLLGIHSTSLLQLQLPLLQDWNKTSKGLLRLPSSPYPASVSFS